MLQMAIFMQIYYYFIFFKKRKSWSGAVHKLGEGAQKCLLMRKAGRRVD